MTLSSDSSFKVTERYWHLAIDKCHILPVAMLVGTTREDVEGIAQKGHKTNGRMLAQIKIDVRFGVCVVVSTTEAGAGHRLQEEESRQHTALDIDMRGGRRKMMMGVIPLATAILGVALMKIPAPRRARAVDWRSNDDPRHERGCTPTSRRPSGASALTCRGSLRTSITP